MELPLLPYEITPNLEGRAVEVIPDRVILVLAVSEYIVEDGAFVGILLIKRSTDHRAVRCYKPSVGIFSCKR